MHEQQDVGAFIDDLVVAVYGIFGARQLVERGNQAPVQVVPLRVVPLGAVTVCVVPARVVPLRVVAARGITLRVETEGRITRKRRQRYRSFRGRYPNSLRPRIQLGSRETPRLCRVVLAVQNRSRDY